MRSKGTFFILLKKYPAYRILLSSSIFTGISTWASFVGTLVLLQQISRSGIELGIVWAVSGLAPIALSLGVGVYVDRFHRKKVLIISDFIRALFYLGFIFIPFMPHLWAILIYSILRLFIGIANSFNRVARGAIGPELFENKDLVPINAVNNAIGSVLRLSGVAFGGIIVSLISLKVVWIMSAITYLISMILMFFLKFENSLSPNSSKRPGFLKEFNQGFKEIWKEPILRVITFSNISIAFIIGTYNLTIIEVVSKTYHMDSYGMSILYVVEGVTSLLVSSLIASKKFLFKSLKSYGILYILIGISWSLFALPTTIVFGCLAISLFAIITSLVSPFESYILQTLTSNSVRGRVYSLLNVINLGTLQIGALFTGIIISSLGIKWVPVLSGVMEVLLGITVVCWAKDLLIKQIVKKQQSSENDMIPNSV